MKITIYFDEYEEALLRKARKDLAHVAKKHGKEPPTMKKVVRGAVRMGVHAIYGEDYLAKGLLDPTEHRHLLGNDSSQNKD